MRRSRKRRLAGDFLVDEAEEKQEQRRLRLHSVEADGRALGVKWERRERESSERAGFGDGSHGRREWGIGRGSAGR